MRRKHWPRHGGLGLGLGVGGGGVAYLLNDSFLTDKAAGSVNGTAAEPGPGTRTVVDTTNQASIETGKYKVAGWSAAGNPGLWYAAIASRNVGQILVSEITLSDFGPVGGSCYYVGYDNNNSGGPGSGVPGCDNTVTGLLRANDGTNSIQVYTLTLATSYKIAIMLKASGASFFIKLGSFWYLLLRSDIGTGSTLYPSINAVRAALYTSDFLRIPTMLWTPRPISADAFGSTWPTTDGGGLTGLEAGGSGKTWTTAVGATWSNAGGFAVNAPVAGPTDLVTNGDFSAWGGGAPPADFPTDWTLGGINGVTHYITQDPAGQARLVSPDGVNVYALQAIVTANKWYRVQIDVKAIGAGGIYFGVGISGQSKRVVTVTPADNIVCTGKADNTTSGFNRYSGATDVTIDNYSTKLLTTAELIQVIDNGVTDFYAEIDITAAAGFQAGIVFNYTDANNFEVVYLNRNDNKVYWDQCLLGTYTNINTSVAVTPGAGYKLAVRRIDNKLYYWYNNIYVHNNTIVSGLNTTSQGLFSTGNGATEVKFDNWKLYAVGSGGEYSLLDMFCN